MKPSNYVTTGVAFAMVTLLLACADHPVTPTATEARLGTGLPIAQSAQASGPQKPNFNLEIILRGEGFGLVRFRQPNAGTGFIQLDTWVRALAPNTSYLLQRAVDVVVDENCTSTAWLTLGKGLQPQAIMTDAKGTGRAELFRTVSSPVGSRFDIHFQVIDAVTGAVVLTSECYQYTIR